MFTFQFLNDKIYSYTKKAIWHLAIWQNWCFGHIFRALISSEKNLPLSFHRITIWQFDKEGVNESHSKLHKTWSLCNIILLFWPAYIWRIFLEKKNGNGCFVFRWQCAEFFFSKIIRQMKAGQNNKYDITKASGLVQVWSHLMNFSKTLAFLCRHNTDEKININKDFFMIQHPWKQTAYGETFFASFGQNFFCSFNSKELE